MREWLRMSISKILQKLGMVWKEEGGLHKQMEEHRKVTHGPNRQARTCLLLFPVTVQWLLATPLETCRLGPVSRPWRLSLLRGQAPGCGLDHPHGDPSWGASQDGVLLGAGKQVWQVSLGSPSRPSPGAPRPSPKSESSRCCLQPCAGRRGWWPGYLPAHLFAGMEVPARHSHPGYVTNTLNSEISLNTCVLEIYVFFIPKIIKTLY